MMIEDGDSSGDSKTINYFEDILSTSNKLEKLQSNLESVIDFFNTPIYKLSTKLCNDCMRLFLESDFRLEHFRKTEDLVWRRVYHDFYRIQKNKRQPLKKQDEHLVESHYMSGIGFYSGLILRIRTRFEIFNATNIIEPLSFSIGPLDNLIANRCLNYGFEKGATIGSAKPGIGHVDPSAQLWARNAIYRSLVYMGDLARYLLEVGDFDSRQLAFRLYRSASRFQPEYGLPFNQLATLAASSNYNLDSICSYMRSASRQKAFEGAEGNMNRIFELNSRHYEEIATSKDKVTAASVIASNDPVRDAEILTRNTIIVFIKLTSSLWHAISGYYDEDIQIGIVEETKLFFETLREAIEIDPVVPLSNSDQLLMDFKPLPGESNQSSRPRYLTPTIMYEFSSMAIMLIAKCRNENIQPIGENLVELTNTLALNLLHYATTKCQRMIMSKLHDLRMLCTENLNSLSETSHNNVTGNSSISSNRSNDNFNSSPETSRKNSSRLRKKKAASNYSDGKRRQNSNYSDLSELEETALSTIDALDISSGLSEEENFEDLIDLDSGSNSDDKYLLKLSRPAIRSTQSQNYESRRDDSNLNVSSNSLPAPDLLTGDLEFHTAVQKVPNPIAVKSSLDRRKQDTSSENQRATCYDSTLAYIYLRTYLPTIKVLFDWLLSNVNVINSNIDSFKNFSSELGNTATLLSEINKIAQSDDRCAGSRRRCPMQQIYSQVYGHKFDNPDWLQKFPLSCDYPLINLSPLKNVHDINIDFSCPFSLNNSEAGFVTTQCIFAFSHALSSFLQNKGC